MSFRSRISEIADTGQEELRDAPATNKALLGATAAGLAFEWGTGNEALIGLVGGHVLDETHSTLLTALAAGSASMTEQAALGLLTVCSIHTFPITMSAIREALNPALPKEQETNEHSRLRRLGGRFIDAFALGTSVNALKNNATHEHTMRKNTRGVVTDTALIGGGVIAIAATAAGATNLGRSMGFTGEADAFVGIITSPLTYTGLFGLKAGSSYVSRRRHRKDRTE